MLVGDCNNGNLYKFQLNQARDGFVFQSDQLKDNVADLGDSMDEIVFGTDFGCITDLKVGPDGLVYVVSLSDGAIYRLVPKQYLDQQNLSEFQYLLYLIPAVGIAALLLYIKRPRKKPLSQGEA